MEYMKNLLIALRAKMIMRAGVAAALLALVSCGSGTDQSSTAIVTGHACAKDSDCLSGQVCGFPTAPGCATPNPGVCLVYPTPGTAHCNSVLLACGCAGSQVGVPCDYPSGYAPAPIKSTSSASCL